MTPSTVSPAVMRRSTKIRALSGTAFSDGVVHSTEDTTTEPLPRNGSSGNRAFSAAMSEMMGAILYTAFTPRSLCAAWADTPFVVMLISTRPRCPRYTLRLVGSPSTTTSGRTPSCSMRWSRQ